MTTSPNGQKRTDDEFISLAMTLLKAIRKRLLLIIIITVLGGVLAWLGSKMLITPSYQTTFRVYVNNALDTSDKTSISSSDLSASRSLASTYSEIIRGRTVLTSSAEKAGLTASYGKLSRMVSVSTGSATEIITVSVTTADPLMSMRYAESIISVAQEQVSSIVDGSSMRVIDEPYLPTGIYRPNYKRNALLGALIGAFLVLLFIILRELLDNRVRDEQSLEERFGYAILGSIPNQEAAHKSGSNYYAYGYARADKEAQK